MTECKYKVSMIETDCDGFEMGWFCMTDSYSDALKCFTDHASRSKYHDVKLVEIKTETKITETVILGE